MPPRCRKIQAVIFDLDDTLFLERYYVKSGFEAVATYLCNMIGEKKSFERWMWRRFLAGKSEKMFDSLNEHFSLNLSKDQIAKLIAVYRQHNPKIKPCRGVKNLLTNLKQRGKKLGLLSDGFLPAQQLKLRAINLERFFDAILFTEEISRSAWKPSPIGFEKIRAKLNVPHRACAYVADNPAKDFLAPNKLGWLTIQWRRRGQIHADNPPPKGGKPKQIVHTSKELLKILLAD